MRPIGRHVTYANVVSTLALVFAVSGGATAIAITAEKNSVTSEALGEGVVQADELGPARIVGFETDGPSAEARCGQNERLLNGGGTVTGPPDVSMVDSSPLGERRWTVSASRADPNLDVIAYATCLKK